MTRAYWNRRSNDLRFCREMARRGLAVFALAFVLLVALTFGAVLAHGQTVMVDQFPGTTLEQKTLLAQALGCSADINVTCVLWFRPELNVFPVGTMPSRGAREIWCDYRLLTGGLSGGGPCGGGGGAGATLKAQRVTTGSCADTGCSVTLTWSAAFADANYTVTCSVEDSTAQSELTGLRVAKIRSKVAASVTVDIDNFSSGAVTGTLNCMAAHDP